MPFPCDFVFPYVFCKKGKLFIGMETKKCIKCSEVKELSLFPKGRGECRKCTNAYLRSYKKNYRKLEKVKEKTKAYNKEYKKKWRKRTDIKLHRLMMCYIKRALEMQTRSHQIFSKLGYTIQELKLDIESKFKEGMSWDNYGEWHIDHIVPRSWTPYNSIEDENFIKCWSLSNLQPLWAKENLSKSNRYSGTPENPIAFLYD